MTEVGSNSNSNPYVYDGANSNDQQIQQYLDQGNVVVTKEVNGEQQLIGAYPPEGIDEIDGIIETTLSQPGDSASIIYNDPKNGVTQTRDYTRDEDGGILMSETKEGAKEAHMTEYQAADGQKYAAIRPKDSDTTYVYDPSTDTTYETDAPPSELPGLVKDGFGKNSDGVYVCADGSSYKSIQSEQDITQSVFGFEDDQMDGGQTWDNFLSDFLQARALHDPKA